MSNPFRKASEINEKPFFFQKSSRQKTTVTTLEGASSTAITSKKRRRKKKVKIMVKIFYLSLSQRHYPIARHLNGTTIIILMKKSKTNKQCL